MTLEIRAAVVLAASVFVVACESGPTEPTWIPGPGVPAVATAQPLRWDSRAELAAWVANGVSKGPISVEGDGPEAFIRVETERLGSGGEVVLRSPDFSAPMTLTGVRWRYRWVVAASSQISGVSSSGALGQTQPVNPPYPPGLLDGILRGAIHADWRETVFEHLVRTNDPIRHLYFRTQFHHDDPGQLDIDWIGIER